MKNKNIFTLPIFKSKKFLIVLAIVLFLCFILLSINDGTNIIGKSKNLDDVNSEKTLCDEYVLNTETKLKNLLLKLSSIEDAEVFIYTSSATEIVYAFDSTEEINEQNIVRQEKILCFSENGNVQEGIIVTKKYPKIEGVLVTVDGKLDEKGRINLINAISAVLDVDINNVEVLMS